MSARGWVLFAVMSLVWGIPYLLIKVAVEGVSVPVLVFTRTAIGAAVLLPAAVRAGGMGTVRRHWRPLLVFAALEILGPWWLLSDAERELSSSFTGLLIATVPILAMALSRVAARIDARRGGGAPGTAGDPGGERIGPARWCGLGLGLLGVSLLAGPHLGGGSGWPITEVLLVALGYATAPLIAARKLNDVPNLTLTASCLTLAALVYAPAASATWPQEMPSARVLAALVTLGVVCTALAFLVFFELIREVGPSRATVFTYVNPVVAVTAGVILLDEPLDATTGIAFLVILVGSVLATASRRGTGGVTAPPPAPASRPTGAREGNGDGDGGVTADRATADCAADEAGP
ncbi:hypothetical protein AQ490_06335 [Wenjunlia vitaminophila]|uniref:EamA domain-containing protein n=1 Tax=Wenjunlia vitaminophila TaxID=76728 RepID=A0A0T6LNL2_WENVI|nr:DMT family transporter [Wenjunlia vitaminophila]KRV47513.1 hypothetical protein AQ490_06335 [Wenjunlia vitaminophila]